MIIGFDNNISPLILNVFIDKTQNMGLSCHHIAVLGMGDLPDELMFAEFSKFGGNVLISCDINITRRANESQALINHNLKIVTLPKDWSSSRISFHIDYISAMATPLIECLYKSHDKNLFKMPRAIGGEIKAKIIR